MLDASLKGAEYAVRQDQAHRLTDEHHASDMAHEVGAHQESSIRVATTKIPVIVWAMVLSMRLTLMIGMYALDGSGLLALEGAGVVGHVCRVLPGWTLIPSGLRSRR